MKRVNFYIDEPDDLALQKISEVTGVSKAWLIRRGISLIISKELTKALDEEKRLRRKSK